MITLNVNDVKYREDLYPRIKHDPTLVQRYAENLEVLPPIEVNQHNILIDGWHRWTAHRKVEATTVQATVTETASEAELFALAIKRNAAHGLQMNDDDKRNVAIRLYGAGTGLNKQDIADTLSVSLRSVNNYLQAIDKQRKEDRKQRIFDLWMACETVEDIVATVDIKKSAVDEILGEFPVLENLPKVEKVLATFADDEFTAPLYNVWTFAKKSNSVSHFGNSEQRIVENLLYLYTEPFDIVVDPFAGGGSTINVCKKRLRRYYVSDRKPIVERESEIRSHDLVTDGVPSLNRRWSDVTLTYLDPPYWRQAQNKYSNDATDLANMSLEMFNESLTKIIKDISQRQSKGVIALLMQPTQWSADNKHFTDHIMDVIRLVGNKKLVLENRISCPYSTEQYNAQQVDWAKKNKKLLVISRELIVWRVVQ